MNSDTAQCLVPNYRLMDINYEGGAPPPPKKKKTKNKKKKTKWLFFFLFMDEVNGNLHVSLIKLALEFISQTQTNNKQFNIMR